MKIYSILSNGYYGGSLTVPDDPNNIDGIPYGTTKKAPPEIPEGMYAVWQGTFWHVTDIPPPVVEQTTPVLALTVDAFYDRFGHAKYKILFSDDPEVQAYILETRNSRFIDLNYPGLSDGVYYLLSKGFEFDPTVVLNPVIRQDEAYVE